MNSPYIGACFNGLTILRVYRDRILRGGRLRCRIRCSVKCFCGNIYETTLSTIINGNPSSCGCVNKAALLRVNTTHGYAAHGQSKTYRAWRSIKERTLCPHNSAWDDYGGRGIKICDRWLKFENFLEDMGDCPHKMTVDRIDVNGDYTPENCRWATFKTQNNNKRSNILVTFNGETKTLSQWADTIGVPYMYFWKKYRQEHVQIDKIQQMYAEHCCRA